MPTASATQTPCAKMQFLIKRRSSASREELISHWFGNHMPRVMERSENDRAEGRLHPTRYWVSLFDAAGNGAQPWDGVAQLWFPEQPPWPEQASGVVPADSFHEKAEPYWPWATSEWVAIDGQVPTELSKVGPPYPCTRSGFVKQVSLVAARPGVDLAAMHRHWLDAHIPNVVETMNKVGGFRYVVSLSMDEGRAPYAGMAELYFPDADAQKAFWSAIKPDGFQNFSDPENTVRFNCGTEMVGIA